MNEPRELLDYWADYEAWRESHDPADWPVSEDVAEMFERHLCRLKPIADLGNDQVRYTMASIYLLELTYPDEATREVRHKTDQIHMTELLLRCAENGMTCAFDNLVTSGVGESADIARKITKDFEKKKKPDWDDDSQMPLYSVEWMAEAMEFWRKQCANSNSEDDFLSKEATGNRVLE